MVSTQLSLPGYKVSETIYEGSRTIVYRGSRETDSLPVVIKLQKNPYPSFSELLRFRNQYTISKNLNFPEFLQTYSLEFFHNSYGLVMADFGGISLKNYFSHREKQSTEFLQQFLEIAIALCKSLDILYQERIIHKDIKPNNILINPQTKQIKLIDFSIASLLPRETQTLVKTNALEGTLAYISPEQTGRMNRVIDYRTDFYSLGVTLYELLTGELPFPANDPMEIVHCHIAKTAPLVHEINPQIPPVLSAIVSKLMAKNAEERYQSALGLKLDLENCLSQLQATGKIETFKIASRDVCDRFIISDKLYGRETEVNTLLEAFERVSQGATEMMLVAGFSGIGKTAVVNEVHKPIVRQRGYFIKGKYDQFQRNIPLSAFVQAFRDLMGQLLTENDQQIQQWQQKILEAVGDNGQVIIEVIPELENIIGAQPPAVELSGTAAENRFNLLLQKFTQVFTSAEHPLVIFVDDLQWADSASLKLMQLLMADTGHLLLIGAYRDNEVPPGHPLMLTLSELQKKTAQINTITLAPLTQNKINQLVADTLKCPEALAKNLAELISQKTQGNPFFATQFLKALHQEGLIQFNFELGCWQCDIAQVKTLAVTDDVVAFMSLQLQKLPPSTQYVLQLAACIGNSFDLDTLAIVSQQSQLETATTLWKALQEGLILPINEVYKFYVGQETQLQTLDKQANVTYRFLHDRVQQAAYSLIADEQKQSTHLQIGRLLLQNYPPSEREERLFDIVNHCNVGISIITTAQERENLAELNLAAGRKAKTATAYNAAINYLNTGIELLPATAWESHYSLSLSLHEEIAEACYLNIDFAQMECWANVVLQQAKTLLDTSKVQQTRILGAKAQGKLLAAIQLGLQMLRSLGIEFPEHPTQADIGQAFGFTHSLWADKSPLELLNLPTMNDPHLLAAMEFLTVLVPAAYVGAPQFMPLMISKQIELCIQFGNCAPAIVAYLDYGLVLCGIVGDIDNGYLFGELALSLLERLQAARFKSRSGYVVYNFIKHWKTPLAETVLPLQEAYRSGLETGDLEMACYNAAAHCCYSYYAGEELTELAEKMNTYRQTIDEYKQTGTRNGVAIYQQTVLNLLGQSEVPYHLSGTIFDLNKSLPELQATNERSSLLMLHINQMFLYYLFEQDAAASQISAQAAQYLNAVVGMFVIPIYSFYDALIQLTQYATASTEQRQAILLQVQQHQDKLQNWANLAPCNHRHRWELVAAEQHRVLGNQIAAIECYDRAIELAKENKFVQDEALANELAAKFYLHWGKEKVAAAYLQDAYYCYARWGAKAKTDHLENSYPNLLHPILQSPTQSLNLLETLTAAIAPIPSTHKPSNSKSSANTSINAVLDLASILKAAQSLSGTIQRDALLHQLTQIILTYAGGDRCAIILPNQDNIWQLEALATTETTQIVSVPLEGNIALPVKLIQYVKNTQAIVVINHLDTYLPVIDDYLRHQQPHSLLCLPLLNQGKAVAILYLENRLTSDVFSQDRLLVLNFLCSQAAISLENARLYTQSQSYAQQLERSLQELSLSEARFQTLAKNIPGVIFSVGINLHDGSQFTPYISSGCYALYGVTAESIMAGEYIVTEFEHPEDHPRIVEAIQESIDNCSPFREEFRIISRTGEMKWIQVASDPQKLEDEIMVWNGFLIDISDRKQYEQQLEQTNAELIRATRLKDEFLATISHELRTPLNAILGMTEGLQDQVFGIVNERQLKALKTVERSGNHLLELINDILDASKIASGQIELDYTYTTIIPLCQQSLEFIKPLAAKKSIQVESKLPANVPKLRLDQRRICQVLINLLNNAVKFTPEGGSITLEVIFPKIIEQQNYLLINVRDTGIGIAAENFQRVFEPFVQIDGTLNRKYQGTGLGLSLVKRIIDMHGGEVSLSSELGVGSCFAIALPIS